MAHTLRDATEADLPAIIAIYNATIPGRMVTGDLEPVPVESRLAWFRQHSPERRPLWVVEDAGKVIAWLSLNWFNERPAYDHTAEVSVYVDESRRREGLGRRLLSRAIERAPALGLRTLVGLIWGHNEPSLRLFQDLGFERWGLLPRVAELDGVERDLVIVGRRVS